MIVEKQDGRRDRAMRPRSRPANWLAAHRHLQAITVYSRPFSLPSGKPSGSPPTLRTNQTYPDKFKVTLCLTRPAKSLRPGSDRRSQNFRFISSSFLLTSRTQDTTLEQAIPLPNHVFTLQPTPLSTRCSAMSPTLSPSPHIHHHQTHTPYDPMQAIPRAYAHRCANITVARK